MELVWCFRVIVGPFILNARARCTSLKDCEVTSATISKRLKEAEQTEEKISAVREKYRIVATRGSVLYFVVADMALVQITCQFLFLMYNLHVGFFWWLFRLLFLTFRLKILKIN